MKPSIWQTPFDPGASYEAAKPFLYAGERFEPGKPFDVGVNLHRARQMYEARRIRKVECPKRSRATATLRKRNRGWYDVIGLTGKPLNAKALRKPEAEQMIRELEL